MVRNLTFCHIPFKLYQLRHYLIPPCAASHCPVLSRTTLPCTVSHHPNLSWTTPHHHTPCHTIRHCPELLYTTQHCPAPAHLKSFHWTTQHHTTLPYTFLHHPTPHIASHNSTSFCIALNCQTLSTSLSPSLPDTTLYDPSLLSMSYITLCYSITQQHEIYISRWTELQKL